MISRAEKWHFLHSNLNVSESAIASRSANQEKINKKSLWCHRKMVSTSPGRYVSIIQSNIELGPKMIQFNIQFKTKFEIFIQSKIHSKISLKYSIQNFIQEIGKK